MFKTILRLTLLSLLTHVSVTIAQPFTQADTTRLSFGTYSGAAQANQAVSNPRMSKNGRFVVFESRATNLVDTSSGLYSGFSNVNGVNRQIYLYDRQGGVLELVSINSALSNAAPMDCYDPVVSADGRYVAYTATTTGAQATTMNSSIDGNLGDGNSCIDRDECHVNYWVDGTHIWVRDRLANKNFLSSQVGISAKVQAKDNGVPKTTVVKRCPAPNCFSVACDSSTQVDTTIPVMTIRTVRFAQGIVTSISPLTIAAASAANPNIGGDGRYVVYDSNSNYLAGVTSPDIPDPVCGTDYNIGADNDGVLDSAYVGMPRSYYIDSNGTTRDVFVRDGSSNTNKIASYGCQYHSPNGCSLQGNQDAIKGAISDDGSKVTWQSPSTNLLDLDFNQANDIYMTLRSSINGEVEDLVRISNASNRIVSSNGASTEAAISADGRYIVYQSAGSNIVSSDTNSKIDVFVYDSNFFTTVRCLNSAGTQGDGDSELPDVSGGGESVVFHSAATNFGASSGFKNAFVGSLSKNDLGRLTGCSVALGSVGAGTGSNADATIASVGIVPRSDSSSGTTVRRRVAAIAYQSVGTNLHSGTADSNGTMDVFQAPTCSSTDAASDQDGDGTSDCFDQCWQDPLKVEDEDTDTDGVPNCEDGCTSDPQKTVPGLCGCGVADTDSDADGTADCNDSCPTDANKIAAGTCGCGQPDVDANANGTIDCVESTNPTPTPGGTPTPNSTPSPTPTPVFTDITPRQPELARATTKTLFGTLVLEGITPTGVVRYDVQLVRRAGRVSSTKNYRVSVTRNDITFRRLSAGSYKIRFRAVHSNGTTTKWSPYSKSVSVR